MMSTASLINSFTKVKPTAPKASIWPTLSDRCSKAIFIVSHYLIRTHFEYIFCYIFKHGSITLCGFSCCQTIDSREYLKINYKNR